MTIMPHVIPIVLCHAAVRDAVGRFETLREGGTWHDSRRARHVSGNRGSWGVLQLTVHGGQLGTRTR
jgi:hypothetical protein